MSADAAVLHLAVLALKATALLLAGALLACAGRRAPARVRHALWTGVLAAVLLLPALHVILPARSPAWLQLDAFSRWTPAPALAGPVIAPDLPPTVEDGTGASPADRAPSPAPARRVPWSALALATWALGAVLVAGRMLAGIVARRRIASAVPVAEDDTCREPLARMAARLGVRTPRLRTLPGAVPATWGVLRPVVLLPVAARAWPADRLDAVLHHELAHVRRRDALWCGVAECARAVFWFHPGVWMARRAALRAQEQAADDLVLRTGGERFSYARALVDTARLYVRPRRASTPALFGHGSELASRLHRLTHPAAAPHTGGWPLAALPLLLAAVVAVVAPLRPLAANDARQGYGRVDNAPGSYSPWQRADEIGWRAAAAAAATEAIERAGRVPPNAASTGGAAAPDTPDAPERAAGYAGEIQAAGLRPASAAELRRLRDMGVTAAFVRAMRDAGLRVREPAEAESLWVQGVTPAFVADVRRAGMPITSPADAVELWIHHVPASYVAEMAGAGADVSRATPIRGLHNHGVRPGYVRELAAAGLPLSRPADILEMHIHKVPAEFVQALRATGLRGLTAREARRLHNFGVDPRDAAQIRTVSGYDRALARIPSLLPG
jgi:beta-lactamase regulating signal transducer with metallopeptidase domain